MENEVQFIAAMQVSGHSFSAKVVTTNLSVCHPFFPPMIFFLTCSLVTFTGFWTVFPTA